VLFRRAIQLSVSGKHWAEVTCGPADPDAAAQSRGFVLFRGTMSYCRSAGQSDISGVFGMAIEATSSVAGSRACFRYTRDHARVRYRREAQNVTLCVLATGGGRTILPSFREPLIKSRF
jgi:hypothetical protein